MNFATLPGTEVEFEDDFDGLYANLVVESLPRHRVGIHHENRLFTPCSSRSPMPTPLPPARRHHEDRGAEGHPDVEWSVDAHSPFRPENDRFWSICSEAGIKLATHLASVTRYAAKGEEWNEPEVMLGDMDAFQWVFYYGDRPAHETTSARRSSRVGFAASRRSLLLSEQARCGRHTSSASSTTRS